MYTVHYLWEKYNRMKSKVNMYKISERQEYVLINTDNTCMCTLFSIINIYFT